MKRKLVVMLLTGVLLSISACSNSTDTTPSDNQKIEQQESDKDKADQKDEPEAEDKAESNKDAAEEDQTSQNEDKSVEITIYASNDDATAFVPESVKLEELTPENIVDALVQKEVLTSDIQVLSCEKQTVDGKESLLVDFNQAFGTYICSMGTTGEYYTIGSVVNTFLDAYGCEQMKITVEGNVLESGHTDYPGYMNRFE